MRSNIKRTIIGGLIIGLGIPGIFYPVMAQDDGNPQAGPQISGTDEGVSQNDERDSVVLDEITVVGEQSLISIRYRIERAEDNLYSMFNELNSSDDFDIVCRNIRITNSHIPQRRCEPVFFSELRKNSAQFTQSELRQAWSEDGIDIAVMERAMDFIEPESRLREQAATSFEALQEEMLRIALENPQYLQSLEQLGQLKAFLEEARQKRFSQKDPD